MTAPPENSQLVGVRVVEDADYSALAALEQVCLPEPWSAGDLATYFGSGAIVGFVPANAPRGGPFDVYALFQLLPGECELLRLGVAPELRGGGLGRALLHAALAELGRGGRPVCHLEVRAANLAARCLYESSGFRSVGRRRAYYADGEDALTYRRDTTSARG
jgi:ribosomal-protein-alanine N-acetyltransferase